MKAKYSTNSFIFGLFFILYGTYAYSIGGDLLKYIILFLGLVLLIFSGKFFKNLKFNFLFFIFSLIYFCILLLISYLLDQESFNTITIIFDIVCWFLFLLGYFFGKNNKNLNYFYNRSKIIIFFLIALGCYSLFKIQSNFSGVGFSTRYLDDDILNNNGIAYVTAQLFILLFWLVYREKNLFYKIILTVSLFLVSLNLLITESRGAILYLILTILFCFGYYLLKFINFKIIFYFITIIFFTSLIVKNVDFINYKIQLTYDRYVLALNYLNNNTIDPSLKERNELQQEFFVNYDDMLFGQQYYKPYPHNQIIEIFMRWGVFGIPIFLISVFSIFKALRLVFQQIPKDSLNFLIISIFIFTYFQSMTSLSLDNNRFLWMGFGFLIGYQKEKF